MVGVLARVVGVAGAVPASATSSVNTCDTASYTCDAAARLSPPDTVARDVRGLPVGPVAVSWATTASVVCNVVSANTGAARFTVNSAGEATMPLYVRLDVD